MLCLRVGAPSLGGSLWPECVAGANPLEAQFPSGEAAAITPCIRMDSLETSIIKNQTIIKKPNQTEYPAKAYIFSDGEIGDPMALGVKIPSWKGRKGC